MSRDPWGASFEHREWWKSSPKIRPAGRLEQKQRSFVLPRRFSRWTLRKYNHLILYPRMKWRTCRKRPLQVRVKHHRLRPCDRRLPTLFGFGSGMLSNP